MTALSRSRRASPLVAAALAPAAVGGQHIASEAARDAARDRRSPFLESAPLPSEIRRPHEATLAARLRSDASIRVRLEELTIRAATARANW